MTVYCLVILGVGNSVCIGVFVFFVVDRNVSWRSCEYAMYRLGQSHCVGWGLH